MIIPFNNLKPLHALIADELNAAVQRVLASGWFILGPEVNAFETEFAAYHAIDHAVSVANGTDALELAIRAAGIGPGDEIITVAHTAVATVCAIEEAGATPVMVDIDPETYTIDPDTTEAAITPRTKAIIPVHIYGQAADMDALISLADKHGLMLIEDCAQAHGARYRGQLVGTFGTMACFSFYPTKNLGAYGDGGAVITNDSSLAERLRRFRNYGQTSRYHHAERGVNSRLDEIQAAILRVKLAHLDKHNTLRHEIATLYNSGLRQTDVIIPSVREEADHVYHLYVVRSLQRDKLMMYLKEHGIGTLIHYPIPVHLQAGYADLDYQPGSLPITEQIVREIVSLPMYVGLKPEAVQTTIQALCSMPRG